jgi:hypothetical protein
MKKHVLKTWPVPFQAIWEGAKLFEFRKDDRGYEVGDELVLREWSPETEFFTGRVVYATVTYLLREKFGLPEGFVIMSLSTSLQRVLNDLG